MVGDPGHYRWNARPKTFIVRGTRETTDWTQQVNLQVKLHQFYTINGIISVKLVEHGPVKTVTHISDLEELFPDINIDDL